MAAISFSNGIEYFELSRPLCSEDRRHDFCVSPDTVLGFSLILENKSQLTSIKNPDFRYFSALEGIHSLDGEVCNIFRGCGAELPTTIIPSAAFVLEVLGRIDSTERENFLKVLNKEERYDLENNPTVGNLENFLTKLIPNELYKFLSILTPSELMDLSSKVTNVEFEKLLDKLSQTERSTILNKLQAIG